VLVQGVKGGVTSAVGAEQKQVALNDWGTTAAVYGRVVESLFPYRLSGKRQASGTLVAKVNVETIIVHERRGAGVTVLAMDTLGGLHSKEFQIPIHIARKRIDPKCSKRDPFTIGYGVGKK
jgi:hypothetical protein